MFFAGFRRINHPSCCEKRRTLFAFLKSYPYLCQRLLTNYLSLMKYVKFLLVCFITVACSNNIPENPYLGDYPTSCRKALQNKHSTDSEKENLRKFSGKQVPCFVHNDFADLFEVINNCATINSEFFKADIRIKTPMPIHLCKYYGSVIESNEMMCFVVYYMSDSDDVVLKEYTYETRSQVRTKQCISVPFPDFYVLTENTVNRFQREFSSIVIAPVRRVDWVK